MTGAHTRDGRRPFLCDASLFVFNLSSLRAAFSKHLGSVGGWRRVRGMQKVRENNKCQNISLGEVRL